MTPRFRLRAHGLRWLGLGALLFATPTTQQLVTHAIALIELAVDDGCPDCAKDEGAHRDCCPWPCQACRCCAHPTTLAVMRITIAKLSGAPERIGPAPEDLHSSSYVAPPFRPPSV